MTIEYLDLADFLPDVDDAERTVMAIASGDLDETATAAWLRQHLVPPAGGD